MKRSPISRPHLTGTNPPRTLGAPLILATFLGGLGAGCGDDTSSSTGSGGGSSSGSTTAASTTTSASTGTTASSSTSSTSSSAGSGGEGGGGDGGGGSSSSSGGAGGAGGSEPVYPLTEGTYDGVINDLENTCGDLIVDIAFPPATIAWTTPTTFDLTFQGLPSFECTREAGGATCESYESTIPVDGQTSLTLFAVEPLVTFVTTESFDYFEPNTIECVGAGCAGLEAEYGILFPCQIDAQATFTLQL